MAGCGSDRLSGPDASSRAASLRTTAGDTLAGPAGRPLATDIVVLVADSAGDPLAHARVTFAPDSASGSVDAAQAFTGTTGTARVRWTLGRRAGRQRLSARVAGLPPLVVHAVAAPGAPVALAPAVAVEPTVRVGSLPLTPPVVAVRDEFGNGVPGVPVTLAVVSGGGTVGTNSRVSDSLGAVRVGDWTMGTSSGEQSLRLSLASGPSLLLWTKAVAGPATVIAFESGDGQAGTAGEALGLPVVVRVVDRFDNPVPAESLAVAADGGGGVAVPVAGTGWRTDSTGRARIRWTLGDRAGDNTLSIGVAALPPLRARARGTAGTPELVEVVEGNGQEGVVGTTLATALVVRVMDRRRNPVATQAVTFSVTAGGGTLARTAAVTDSAGKARSGEWTLGRSAGQQTVSATTGTIAPAVFGATGRPGAPSTVVLIAPVPTNATVGAALPNLPTVAVRDAFGNAVPTTVVRFEVIAGGGTIARTADTTDGTGHASSGTWTLGQVAGTQTLRATVTGLPVVTMSVQAQPGTPALLSVASGAGQTVVAGTPLPVSPAVRLTDALGNVIRGATVNFAVGSGGGTITGASAVTDSTGVARVGTWTTGNTLGSQTLRATHGTLPAVTITATAVAGPPTQVSFEGGLPAQGTVGAALGTAPAVLVRDAGGNPVSRVQVRFDVTAGGGLVIRTIDSTDANGRATAGNWTLGTAAGVNTLRATAGTLVPVSASVTGRAGPATQVAIVSGGGQIAPVGTQVAIRPTVQIRDAFGNGVSGTSVTFAVTLGGGTVQGATSTSDQNGRASPGGWVLGPVAGVNRLSATVAGLAPVTFTATGQTVSLGSITIAVGDGQEAAPLATVAVAPSVVIRNQFGAVLANVPVTFAIGVGGGTMVGPATVNTNASGVATIGGWALGSSTGLNTLTATASGYGTVTFSGTAVSGGPPSQASWPNEPNGMTVVSPGSTGWESVTEGNWTSGTRDGWQIKFLDGSRSVGIASSSSIVGEQRTLRHTYPANHISGGGVEAYLSVPGNYTRVYLGMYVRVSPNFHGHGGSGINKLAYIRTSAPGNVWSSLWVEVLGAGNQTLVPYFVNQLNGGTPGRIPESTLPFSRGDWHRVEVLFEMAPVARARYWLDGVLAVDAPNIGGPSATTFSVTEVTLSGILGGTGPSGNPQEQFIEYDRVRISGSR